MVPPFQAHPRSKVRVGFRGLSVPAMTSIIVYSRNKAKCVWAMPAFDSIGGDTTSSSNDLA